MRIFEYPYVIITILFFCFVILGAVGLYFAMQGVKAAKGTEEKDFSNVSKLERKFNKWGRLRSNRCVIYVSVSLENVQKVYSDAKGISIFSEMKPVLLKFFSEDEYGDIALHEQKNFIVLNNWNAETARINIENCVSEINRRLLKHEALKIVDVKFGYYCEIATQVTFDDAISRAKQACMQAENDNTTHIEWNNNMGKALEKKIKIENNIESEINNNNFFLEYQPVLDAKTKKIIGAEVLSRLNSSSDGVLAPGSFLSAVDSVGLNNKFDYYIFEKNCKWISNNREEREGYKYTVNFSRATLSDPLFPEKIMAIVDKYKLKYSTIAIEMLEDKHINGDDRIKMIENLSVLKQKGISILLDDFGSGYASFGDLQNLDINTVKIDKSITQNAGTEMGFLILKNVIRTAKELGFETLCEGIETEEHENAAIKAGCDMLQGFYYYRPMPVAKLEQLFETNGKTEI